MATTERMSMLWCSSCNAGLSRFNDPQLTGRCITCRMATPQQPRSTILEAAEAAVDDRHKKNDIPERNFDRIAKSWSALLNIDITPAQVALMMISLKVVREAFSHQTDNLVDIVGYTLCLEEIDNGSA